LRRENIPYEILSEINSILILLEKYDNICNEPDSERRFVKVIGEFLDKNHLVLNNLGFGIYDNGDTIKDENFQIRLTRFSPNDLKAEKFLIRRLNNGDRINPDEVYYSFGYSKSLKEENDISVISDFVRNLRNRI